MKDVVFEFYIGDTYTRDFTISDYSAEISEIFFSVKRNINDKRTVLQKKLSDNGITLVDEIDDEEGNPTSRTYNILINADETEDLKPDVDYSFDIEIITPVLGGENIKKTIIEGIFRVNNATTRNYNE